MTSNIKLTDELFTDLVRAASLASSADNMQPWEFRCNGQFIEVRRAVKRELPTDVMGMFTWVGLGAAIQNMVVAAEAKGMLPVVEYRTMDQDETIAATIKLFPGRVDTDLAPWIPLRATNRNPFQTMPLESGDIYKLTEATKEFRAGVYWTTAVSDLKLVSSMDANLSYIRLEHKPLLEELYQILRFSRKEMEGLRYGLDFKSLQVPFAGVLFARLLKVFGLTRIVYGLGLGRILAKKLATRITQAGALCLITACEQNPGGYMEAGRAMEKLWLKATSSGLSIQPYGVLPQYLTKAELEPHTFPARYLDHINKFREPFFTHFPDARNEYPAILLRVGRAEKASHRSFIRLNPEQIVRK